MKIRHKRYALYIFVLASFMQKTRYQYFLENFSQDLLLFFFFLFMLSVYRAAFIFCFSGELMPGTPSADIWLTLWHGFRISLKTSAALLMPGFLFGTLAGLVSVKWPAKKIRFCWAAFAIIVLSLLFETRIPYYKEFHNAFDPFIFNTGHDDVLAIADTAIKTYGALWRIPLALAFAAAFSFLLRLWLRLDGKIASLIALPEAKTGKKSARYAAIAAIVLFIPWFAVYMRHGGSLTYDGSIYWKNSARMSQHLLNEAILDDVQALYKASRIFKYFLKNTENMTDGQAREAASLLAGHAYQEDSLLPLLEKTSKGYRTHKPRHIFVIVAETYMLWPLWEKYADYHLADGVKALASRKDAVLVQNFLPASNGTMFGLASVLLGLPEINLYTANRAKGPYHTALSVQLKKLGYENRFWYGGYPSWENVDTFMNTQEFDKSYFMASFGNNLPHNAWGIEDKHFMHGIAEKFTDNDPSFNLILTSSNHPPYSVDMSKEPDIPSAKEYMSMLPDNFPDKAAMAEKLQNFRYSDKYIAEFINAMYAKYPDSLFVLTGDHGNRYAANTAAGEYERCAVPFLILGKGINKADFAGKYYGAHTDIAATVMERILPKGEKYYALGTDIFGGNLSGLHSYDYLYKNAMGDLSSDKAESIDGNPLPPESEIKAAKDRMDAMRKITWHYVMKGENFSSGN